MRLSALFFASFVLAAAIAQPEDGSRANDRVARGETVQKQVPLLPPARSPCHSPSNCPHAEQPGSHAYYYATIMPLTQRPSNTIDLYARSFLEKNGYPFEEHVAETKDGYLLTMHRIPRPGAPVIVLQHGILGDSWNFLVNTDERSIAQSAFREGYDVWMFNNRGSTCKCCAAAVVALPTTHASRA